MIRAHGCSGGQTYLGLSVLAIIVGNSYIVEQAVELVDDAVHLLGQVTGVHLGRFHGERIETTRIEQGPRQIEDRHAIAGNATKGEVTAGAPSKGLLAVVGSRFYVAGELVRFCWV